LDSGTALSVMGIALVVGIIIVVGALFLKFISSGSDTGTTPPKPPRPQFGPRPRTNDDNDWDDLRTGKLHTICSDNNK